MYVLGTFSKFYAAFMRQFGDTEEFHLLKVSLPLLKETKYIHL